MEAHSAFTRGGEPFVPPERVMTRLMRRTGEARRLWLDYLILGVFIAGMLAGLFLAAKG